MACQQSQQTRDVDPKLVQCWLRRWPIIKPALVQRLVFAGLRSIAAGLVVLIAGGDYKPSPTQCLLNVGPASPVLASIHSALLSTSCWRYRHDALNQSWVDVGPPSVTLAHIQCGAKQKTVTQYWANVGSMSRRWVNISPALGQRLVFAGAACDCTIETAGQTDHDRNTEQTEIRQMSPPL